MLDQATVVAESQGMGVLSRRCRRGSLDSNGIGRIYLRVAALGILWCALGLALGIILTIRLSAIRTDARMLSTERLPAALALHTLDEKLAHADALAHQLVRERAEGDDTTATIARLSQVLDSLERATRSFDPSVLADAQASMAAEARASITTVLEECRALLVSPQHDSASGSLAIIAREAERSDERLESINDRTMTPALSALAHDLQMQAQRAVGETLTTGTVAFVLGTLLTVIVARLVFRKEHEQADDRERQEFQSRIADAFGMATDEESAFRLIEQVVERVLPTVPTEVLLADSSRAHLNQVAASSGAGCGSAMCSVKSPSLCPAVRRGFPLSFTNSESFDACPNLRGRPGGACSATCVPLSVMGQHVGVVHAVTPVDQPLDAVSRHRLTVLAAKSGERIGVLRAFAQSEQQAARDPLTGLMNRRSLEGEVQRLQRSATPFCVAYADIDHFKQLNDTHGHETGDKALRLFSRVLRESLRPSDVVARWGGEEFVVLLPHLELTAARVALERVREAIREASGGGLVPHFTVSIGVTRCGNEDDFFERLDEADAALLAAKGAGRDRVIISDAAITLHPITPADAPPVPAAHFPDATVRRTPFDPSQRGDETARATKAA